ncbi:MAG: 2-amino-4-hydroxy-6-hydroxymethyldihydropteridine diphosphokinase [Methanobrevibacter sp. CfCl-M3]
MVFGAGPSIKKHVKYLKTHNKKFNDYTIIVADGAISALLEEDIVPEIIVTDLDGKIDDLLIANSKGTIFVIHGHGNNIDLIKKYTNSFNKVLGTTQSIPLENIYNFGGFTDGDRAVFLAESLGAKKIVLGGMDFGKYVTSYSRPNIKKNVEIADDIKIKKLEYGEKLVNWIKQNKDVHISSIDKNNQKMV